MELDARDRRRRAALAAVLVGDHAPEVKLMHELLGIHGCARGMGGR
jgi:hypothetical protein